MKIIIKKKIIYIYTWNYKIREKNVQGKSTPLQCLHV